MPPMPPQLLMLLGVPVLQPRMLLPPPLLLVPMQHVLLPQLLLLLPLLPAGLQ